MARDQRTRLNAELSHQYSTDVGKATPGRSSLTENLTEKQDGEQEHEGELEEQEPEMEGQEAEVVAREPKKSIFELPRKEPARPPLASPDKPQPAAPAPFGKPPTRRG